MPMAEKLKLATGARPGQRVHRLPAVRRLFGQDLGGQRQRPARPQRSLFHGPRARPGRSRGAGRQIVSRAEQMARRPARLSRLPASAIGRRWRVFRKASCRCLRRRSICRRIISTGPLSMRNACCGCRISRRPAIATTSSGWRRTPTRISSPCCRRPMSRAVYPAPRRGWIKAPRIPGSFVINAGDMCRRWTNDRFLSTQHLAINLTDRHRYSTPFFYTPQSIGRSPACRPAAVPENPPKYPPITYGEYRVWWLNTNYGAKLDPRAKRKRRRNGRSVRMAKIPKSLHDAHRHGVPGAMSACSARYCRTGLPRSRRAAARWSMTTSISGYGNAAAAARPRRCATARS